MTKRLWIILAAAVVIAGCVLAWFYGYHSRKSNDNLPSLAAIAEMSESEVNNILPGYDIEQLREVWGEPDSSDGSTDHWKVGSKILLVSYKNKGLVVVCGLKDETGASVGG